MNDQRSALAPAGAAVSTVRHRVAFFETDAMGIVHHANYVNFLELARVQWLDEYDQPYRVYAAQGMHFATIRVNVEYHHSCRFDEVIEISAWLDWVRGASLCMAYEICCADVPVVSGSTVHAAVNDEGRVRRIPAERLKNLRSVALREGPKNL